MSNNDTYENFASSFDRDIETFMHETGPVDDDTRFKHIQQTFSYRFNLFFFKISTLSNSFYIEKNVDSSSGSDRSGMNFLCFRNVFSVFRSMFTRGDQFATCPKTYYIILIVNWCISVRCALIGYYRFVLDGLQARWHPYSRSGSVNNTTLYANTIIHSIGSVFIIGQECARPEDIIEPNLELRKRINLLMDKIRAVGSPGLTTNVLIAYLSYMIFIFWCIFSFSVLTLSSKRYRVDSMNFIYDPICERKRVRKSVEKMAHAMTYHEDSDCSVKGHGGEKRREIMPSTINGASIKSNEVHKQTDDKSALLQPKITPSNHVESLDADLDKLKKRANSNELYSCIKRARTASLAAKPTIYSSPTIDYESAKRSSSLTEDEKLARQTSGATQKQAGIDLIELTQGIERKDHGILIEFVNKNNLLDNVRPSSLTMEAFMKSVNAITYWIVLFQLLIYFAILYFALSVLYIELEGRAQTRLKKLSCESLLPPNGTVIRDLYGLDPLDNDLERQVYFNSNIKGTTEFKNIWPVLYIELRHMMTPKIVLGVVELISLFVYLAARCSFYIILLSETHIYIMIWVKQLHDQLVASNKLLQLYGHFRAHDLCGTRRKQLARALAITYLNLSLFRIQFKHSRALINFLAASIFAISVPITAHSYVTLFITSSQDMRLTWVTNLFCLVCVNLVLYECGDLTKNIEKLSHKLVELMARASENSMETSPIINLLRREMITNREVQQLYSIQVFEFEFSRGFMISFNSYLLVVGLFMWRSIATL